MSKAGKVGAFLVAFLFSVSVDAQSDHTTIGVGASTCWRWTEDKRVGRYHDILQDHQWVLGFLSGIGFLGAGYDPLNGLEADVVWAWVDKYCFAHPLVTIEGAAGQFIKEHPK
jgi:hypothetical protein